MKFWSKVQLTAVIFLLLFVFVVFGYNDGYFMDMFTHAVGAYVQERINGFFDGLFNSAVPNTF